MPGTKCGTFIFGRIFEDAEDEDDEEREERGLQEQDDELGAVADFQDDVAADELQPLLQREAALRGWL